MAENSQYATFRNYLDQLAAPIVREHSSPLGPRLMGVAQTASMLAGPEGGMPAWGTRTPEAVMPDMLPQDLTEHYSPMHRLGRTPHGYLNDWAGQEPNGPQAFDREFTNPRPPNPVSENTIRAVNNLPGTHLMQGRGEYIPNPQAANEYDWYAPPETGHGAHFETYNNPPETPVTREQARHPVTGQFMAEGEQPRHPETGQFIPKGGLADAMGSAPSDMGPIDPYSQALRRQEMPGMMKDLYNATGVIPPRGEIEGERGMQPPAGAGQPGNVIQGPWQAQHSPMSQQAFQGMMQAPLTSQEIDAAFNTPQNAGFAKSQDPWAGLADLLRGPPEQ